MKKVLVVGDTLVDNYIFGEVSRISPEAPIPVLDYRSEKKVLGGAANVAANIASLCKDEVRIDYFGFADWFVENELKNININHIGIPSKHEDLLYKNRYVCNRHQLLRVDNKKYYNQDLCLVSDLKFCSIDLSIYDIIVVSDYNKGTFSKSVFEHIVGGPGFPALGYCGHILADLKSNKDHYENKTEEHLKNITLKINSKEWKESFQYSDCLYKNIVITKGSDGYEILGTKKSKITTVGQNEIVDVVGAGDVFLAGMAAKLIELDSYDLEKMCTFGNKAAGEKVKHFGTTVIKRGWLNE